MDSYGFNSVLSMGNQHNEGILKLNEQIRQSNAVAISKRQEDITKQAASQANLETSQEKSIGEAVGGQVASKGKDIQAVGKVIKSAPQIGEAVLNATEDALFGREQFAIQGVRDDTAGSDLLNSAKSFLQENVSVGESIGQKASSIGKLGIASTGLTIGLGALDLADDLESHKIIGNNSAERLSNEAGIVSAGLELAGTAMDLTGVGAPIGVALNLAGGLAGLVSGGSEVVGEEQEKQASQQDVSNLQKAPVPQQKLASLSNVESSGAVVR
tara:strand:+ start:20395 stop:21207 length:813 start_codon:yes stop_codon:yes gene_type:complete